MTKHIFFLSWKRRIRLVRRAGPRINIVVHYYNLLFVFGKNKFLCTTVFSKIYSYVCCQFWYKMDTARKLQIFNRLYADYQKRFVRFAYIYVRDLEVAEDITADAFAHYWENFDLLASDTSAPAYLISVIKNKSLTYLKHEQVRKVVEEKLRNHMEWELRTRMEMLEAYNPEELFTAEIQTIVDRTLAALPEQTRRIFLMSRYQNLPYKEIAGQSDMTVKGVEFHVSKALKSLRINLKDYLPVFLYLFL